MPNNDDNINAKGSCLRTLIDPMPLEDKVKQLVGIGKSGEVFGSENAEVFGTAGAEEYGIPPLIMGHSITGVRSGRISRVKATYFCAPGGRLPFSWPRQAADYP